MSKCFIDNKIQVADILEEVIGRFPDGCRLVVRQATFSISEEFIRRIWRIKVRSNARFILVIDRKALQKTRLLWRFLSRVYDRIYLADSHAKILLVSPEDEDCPNRPVSVITSQNLTRGNRYESSIISEDPDVFSSLLKDFDHLTKFHSVPMSDIMPVPNPENPENPNNPENPTNPNNPNNPNTPDPLADLEYLASLFLPISDIAVILERDQSELRDAINTPGTPEYQQYKRGKAKSKAHIRAQEMQLAKLGSPLGVQNVRDNLIDMEEDE